MTWRSLIYSGRSRGTISDGGSHWIPVASTQFSIDYLDLALGSSCLSLKMPCMCLRVVISIRCSFFQVALVQLKVPLEIVPNFISKRKTGKR